MFTGERVVIRGSNQRERVKDRRFAIAGKSTVQLCQSCAIRGGARLERPFRIAAVKRRGSLNEALFAFGLMSFGLRFADQLAPALQIFGGGPVPKLVIVSHGIAPVGHGATRIMLFDLLELFLRDAVAKRMQQCQSAVEPGLRGG